MKSNFFFLETDFPVLAQFGQKAEAYLYSDSNAMFDIWVMLIAGVVSFLIQKKGIPTTPIILTFVLGPTFELKVRQALEISNCDLTVFIRQPISLFFLIFAAVMCSAPALLALFKKIKAKK